MSLQAFLLAEPGGESAHFPGDERDVRDTELVAELPQSLVLGGAGLDGGVGVGKRLVEVRLDVQVVTETYVRAREVSFKIKIKRKNVHPTIQSF